MSKFCAKCGRLDNGEVAFIGNLCIQCYLEEHEVLSVPSEVTLHICRNCFSYRWKNKWFKFQYGRIEDIVEDFLYKILEDKIRFKISPEDSMKLNVTYELELPSEIRSTQFTSYVVAKISDGRNMFQQKYPMIVKISFTLCPNCLMRVSKTYKAIVQVRSARNYLDKVDRRKIERILKEIDPYNIIDIEELREGINIKVSDSTTARILASKIRNETGAVISESFEHVRRNKEGKRTSKLIIVARLPKYRENDVVIFRNEMYRIEKISGFRVVLRNEISKKKITVSAEALWNGRVVSIPDNATYKRYLVIGRDDKVVYVVDFSENYEVKEIPLGYIPENVKPGDELRIVIINGKPYVLGKA